MTAAAKDRSILRFGEPQIECTLPAFHCASFVGVSNYVQRRLQRPNCTSSV
jgi:hypothetical protein